MCPVASVFSGFCPSSPGLSRHFFGTVFAFWSLTAAILSYHFVPLPSFLVRASPRQQTTPAHCPPPNGKWPNACMQVSPRTTTHHPNSSFVTPSISLRSPRAKWASTHLQSQFQWPAVCQLVQQPPVCPATFIGPPGLSSAKENATKRSAREKEQKREKRKKNHKLKSRQKTGERNPE